ncbi:MAG: serine/threonine-protein kinase [Planctomycetota bacterium]
MNESVSPPPPDDDASASETHGDTATNSASHLPTDSADSEATAATNQATNRVDSLSYDDSSEAGGEENTLVSDGRLVAPDSAYAGLRPRDLGKALVGHTIDSVLLEAFVGGGGMGAVFRGRDVALQRTVAVKVLATHNATGGDIAKRFEVEAQSAARLDHPNIARIYHVGQEHGLQYIVFEFIDGQNLRDIVADYGPQPVTNVLSYAVQLADALAHAWQRQVVHRDIKPSNILVTKIGQAKLVDMGLARLHQVEPSDQDLTATGATLGTFDYIAPEQARDPRDADIRSDIYSLGCTLFFLLTGKPPFPDGTALQKLLRHQADAPPDIRAERPDVSKGFAKTLEKMLAKRPEARQQDPGQLVRELVALAQPLGITTPSASVLAAGPAPTSAGLFWRTHAPWAVSAALLLILGVTLPGLLAPKSPPRVFDPLPTAGNERGPTAAPVDKGAAATGPIWPGEQVLEDRGEDFSPSADPATPVEDESPNTRPIGE